MEIYDILMLVIIVGAALYGAIKGFAWQLASIASIVVSYIVAYRFREPFSQSIQAEPPWNRFLAMLILFIGTSLVIWVVFRMISNTIDRMKLREFDRQIGFLFGAVKGFLYCTLITLFAVTLMGKTIRSKIVASKSGHFIAEVLDRSDSVIPEEIHVVIGPYLDRFDERFSETKNGMQYAQQNGQPNAPQNDPNLGLEIMRETGMRQLRNWLPGQAQSGSTQPGQNGTNFGSNYQPYSAQPQRSSGPSSPPNYGPQNGYQRAQAPDQQPYYRGF